MSPSTDTPVRTPIASSAWTRSSSGRLPEAPGANGQPPRPPTLPSIRTAPASIAASALAMARPRVSCRCTPTSSPVAERTAPTSELTSGGVATPIVSASEIASAPTAAPRSAAATTALTGTSSSYGQPKAVASVSSTTATLGAGQRDHLGERGQRVGRGLPRVVPAVGVAHRHDVLEVAQPGSEGALRARGR